MKRFIALVVALFSFVFVLGCGDNAAPTKAPDVNPDLDCGRVVCEDHPYDHYAIHTEGVQKFVEFSKQFIYDTAGNYATVEDISGDMSAYALQKVGNFFEWDMGILPFTNSVEYWEMVDAEGGISEMFTMKLAEMHQSGLIDDFVYEGLMEARTLEQPAKIEKAQFMYETVYTYPEGELKNHCMAMTSTYFSSVTLPYDELAGSLIDAALECGIKAKKGETKKGEIEEADDYGEGKHGKVGAVAYSAAEVVCQVIKIFKRWF